MLWVLIWSPCWDASKEYPQHMFSERIKKKYIHRLLQYKDWEKLPVLAHLSWKLEGSYCDHSVVVVRLSIHNFFEQHLPLNRWANFNQIPQEWSLGGTDSKLFKDLESMQDSDCHSNQKKNLKNLLVRNQRTDFNIIWQKCSFGNPLPRLFKLSWFVKKHGGQGAGLIFPIYLYRKIKKSSCQKPLLDQFQYNLAEMFLWWPSTKIIQDILIRQKTWRPGGEAYVPYISI